MHKIVKSHLKTFVEEYELHSYKEDKQFEYFVNFCLASKSFSGRINPKDITTYEDDAGIDGIFFLIDGDLVVTLEDANVIFSGHRRNLEVEVVFTQIKTSEGFEKKEIANFSDGVFDFLSDTPALPQGEFIKESKEIFDLIVENVNKIKEGKPRSSMYYCTSGVWEEKKELEGIFSNAKRKIEKSGYFRDVFVSPIDRDKLIKIWTVTQQPVEATVKVKGYIPFEKIRDVSEAYLAIIPAKNFVESVLLGEDDRIRAGIFDENVRSFLGEDNDVNSKIIKTLKSDDIRDRFAILNNGVTVVSPDVRVQSDSISMYNYQIVNGCQTSHVLFRNRQLLDENTMLTVKVIEAEHPDVVNQIVEATNNQSYVADEKFLSLKDKAKSVEVYFNTCNEEVDNDSRIYFERREKQYAGLGVQDAKIFDIRTVARAFAAMFLDIPHTSASYPTQIFTQSESRLFADDQHEITYYCSTLALYKFNSLFNSKKLPGDFGKYKWHTLMLLKYVINKNEKLHPMNSKKIEKYCERIIDRLKAPNKDCLKYYKECEDIITKAGLVTKDRLKRSLYTNELKQLI
ncbi:hypothetical protein WA1_42210 [Scytonema hofmannii PCC 7110]|uniref:Abortive phage infection protein C-terminal domain-containing protein n=1 Tax=Scytonema hofmannii PCC 7110 TaxID=128403 RepID=A0A139WV69_9CYAN|nr:AIPR family protein [Scytonema hofmannii]KYC36338.1 hypothetical protein WA1_42210 [Scytonema hofmannii PCC 7110]